MAAASRDVPWTVAWTGEQAFRLQPSAHFPGAVELDQKQAMGVGEPKFATMHVTRQRRGLADLVCHVCGKPTGPQDRYIFPAASGGMVALRDGTQQYGLNVPPMHRACAVRARHACPHLAKVDEPPLRCSRDDGRLIQRPDITPGLEELAAQLPKGQEVVLSCYRLYGPEFTAKVVRARADWEAAVRARRARRRARGGGAG